MARKFDLILFGATGFTGKYVIEKLNLLEKTGKYPRKFTWAIAGRSVSKMRKSLEQVSAITSTDLSGVEMIEADVDNLDSLRKMAAQCTVLVSVVGPYLVYGENQIKACVAESTNYVDLTGEVPFICDMQIKYDQAAREKQVYIVNSCGYDSILVDSGLAALQESFQGELNEAACTVVTLDKKAPKGAIIHYGTYYSIVQMLARAREVAGLEKQLFPEPLPEPKFKAARRWPISYNNDIGKWCIVLRGPDTLNAKRSQYLLSKADGRRPVQVEQYMAFPSIFFCFGVAIIGFWLFVLSQCSFTRRILEKYPRIFTLGLASHEGPRREEAEASTVQVRIDALGWNEKKYGTGVDQDKPPTVQKNLTVTCKNPGYGATGIMLIESALSILFEKEKMPATGGVIPPGAAFAKTDLSKRLTAAGVKFEYQN